MKIKSFFLLIALILLSNLAFAICDLRASAADLRDGGITFDITETAALVIPEGGGQECNPTINATGLPNPRSNILSEIKSPETLFFFTQALEIKSVSLQGSGQIKFMSVDFYRTSGHAEFASHPIQSKIPPI